MAARGSPGRGRGRGGRGRGRGRGGWRAPAPYPPPPIVRPIFDWSEVREHFPQVAPQLDSTLLTQLLSKRVQEITPSVDEQGTVQGFCSKVSTVLENMILTGEGEELLLDEVRAVGSQKKGTALAGNTVADLVILLRDLPSDTVVKKLSLKVVDLLNSAQEDGGKEEVKDGVTLTSPSSNIFELKNPEGAITRVYVTTTGDKVYGIQTREIADMQPYENALRMIRHARWWEDHTSHLKSVRPLVRILKDMKKHVPGLASLNPWYIELLSNCAVIPLVGDEPYSLVESFKRAWQLLSAGLFLPGSIGIPDPCEESDSGIHENLPPEESDKITRNAQMILQMLNFGAYREVLAVSVGVPELHYPSSGIVCYAEPGLRNSKLWRIMRLWSGISAALFLGIKLQQSHSASPRANSVSRTSTVTFEYFSYSAFKMPPKPCVVTRPKTCVVTRESSTTFTIVIADATYTLSFKSEEELCSMEIVLRTLESQLAEFFRSERRPPYIRLLLCGTIYVLSADNRPRMQGRSTRSIRFVLDHPSPNCTVTREDDKEYQVVFDRECYSLSLPDPDILLKPERLFTVCGLVESKMGSDPRRYPLRLCVTGLVCVLNFVRLHRPSDVDMVKTIPCFCSVETMPR